MKKIYISPLTAISTILAIICVSVASYFLLHTASGESAQTSGMLMLEENKDKLNWTYKEGQDPKKNEKTYFAKNISINEINLGVPHTHSKMELEVEKEGKTESVRLTSYGQLNCYAECAINVVFDQGDIKKYHLEPVNKELNRNNILFIKEKEDFLSQLRKSNTLIIDAQIMNSGSKKYYFAVSGLKL